MPETDPGVTVAPGDPGAIRAAGAACHQVSTTLADHADLYLQVAGSPEWSGASANQYRWLSQQISASCATNAGEASKAADSLIRFGEDLDDLQGKGRQALQDAIEWMGQVNTWTQKLETAEATVSSTQGSLSHLQGALNALTSQTDPSTSADTEAIHMSAEITVLNQSLHSAQDDVTVARQKLTQAKQELADAQRRGGQALAHAEQAAGDVMIALSALNITPPPWVMGGLSSANADPVDPDPTPLDDRDAVRAGGEQQGETLMDLMLELSENRRELEIESADREFSQANEEFQQRVTQTLYREDEEDEAQIDEDEHNWSGLRALLDEDSDNWEDGEPKWMEARTYYDDGWDGEPGSEGGPITSSEWNDAWATAEGEIEGYEDE